MNNSRSIFGLIISMSLAVLGFYIFIQLWWLWLILIVVAIVAFRRFIKKVKRQAVYFEQEQTQAYQQPKFHSEDIVDVEYTTKDAE